MATRERRLAEFNGNGEPPPDQPVQVLCEDHSGTYQLPFACRWVDGEWRNNESGDIVEATVVGWRLPRFSGRAGRFAKRQNGQISGGACTKMQRKALPVILRFGTRRNEPRPNQRVGRLYSACSR